MNTVVFMVSETDEGLLARAVGASIFTDASNPDDLRRNVAEAVRCHYGTRAPRYIQLLFSDSAETVELI